MKTLLAAAVWLCLTAPSMAFDHARVLLSDHAVLCSPNTPVATVRHLVETWGALICVVATGEAPNLRLEPWVAVRLAPGTDSASTADSLSAWKARLQLTTVVSENSALVSAAHAAGLRAFAQTPEFRPGGLAIRDGRGYVHYEGPSSVFFDRQGLLLDPNTRSRLPEPWKELATSLAAAFSPGSDTSVTRWHTLLAVTRRADSLSARAGSNPALRTYGERWRSCLSWWLSPTITADTLRVFVAQKESHALRLVRGEGVVSLAGIQGDPGAVSAYWNTPWPLELARDTSLVSGLFRADQAGSFHWVGRLEFEFDRFRFTRTFSFPVNVVTALQARLLPPVLFMDGPYVRTDPDYEVAALSGQLELLNGSASPLAVHLDWLSDGPGQITPRAADLSLLPGEKKRTSFTVNLPRDPAMKDYTFGVDLSAGGVTSRVAGQIWKSAPHKSGSGRLGVVGSSGTWLTALPDLGLKVDALVPGALMGELASLEALVIRGGTAPAGESDVHAVSDFAARGGVVILEIDREALQWLPWQVSTIRKPAPYAASFYKEELAWWHSPNGLVGGCFAAIDRDSVLTLAAGESGWEPLVIDDLGKGFMYRRQSGHGWYILVHSGWWPRLEQVERRAHLGLFNLVSAASN